MKRSEMLKLIKQTIDSSCGNDGEKRLYPEDSYLAFNILNAIEKAGMLPPDQNKDVEPPCAVLTYWEEE